MLASITICLLFAAYRAGWARGGGPRFWYLGIMFSVTVIAFSVRIYPSFSWISDGWERGLPVATRLIGLFAIGVWTMAGLTPARLIRELERWFYPISKILPRFRQLAIGLTVAMAAWGWMRIETDRIKQATIARGIDFRGSLSDRLQKSQLMLFQTIAIALRRADTMTVALYCRGWRDDQQRLTAEAMPNRDLVFCVLTAILVIGVGFWQRW